MSKKDHPAAEDLRRFAIVMRKFADVFDQTAMTMDENKLKTLEIDNWTTAIRGFNYINNSVKVIAAAHMLGTANGAVRELIDIYKSQEATEEKRSSAKKRQ